MPGPDPNLAHRPRYRRLKTNFHFHGFKQPEPLAHTHTFALFDMDCDDHGGRSRANLARGLKTEAIGLAFELEAEGQLGNVIHQTPDSLVNDEPRAVRTFLAQGRRDGPTAQVNSVAPGTNGINHQPIALSPISQINLLTLTGWNPLSGERRGVAIKEISSLMTPPLVGHDGAGHQGVLGLAPIISAKLPSGLIPAIEPGRIHGSRPVGLGTEQLDEIALVARAPLDHQIEIAQGTLKPGSGLFAVVPRSDDFGDQRIEFR